MNCSDFREELALWLAEAMESDASGRPFPASLESPNLGLPESLEEHAAVCPGCAVRLRAASALLGMRVEKPEPPADLSARVMHRIRGTRPKQPAIRRIVYPALAAAAMVIASLVFFIPGKEKEEGMIVRFYLEAPGASRVFVVGDWNGWDPKADPMVDREGNGVWETEVRLSPGMEYRYQFFIDGETWTADPASPLKVDDGFGGMNSVLQL